MSRYLHVQKTPVSTRPAATLMLLRDGSQGIEVLMTRRSETASFAPGVYVFPGGALDPEDETIAADPKQCQWREGQSLRERHSAVAAIREAFEELGILIGAKTTEFDRDQALSPQLKTRGIRYAADQLYSFSHWITDRDMPKRFDVLFFVARMPAGQDAIADEGEQFEPTWVSPTQALKDYQERRFKIIFPTIRTLQALTSYATVDQVLAACAGRPLEAIEPSCPRGGLLNGKEERFQEHELAFGELEFVAEDGKMFHELKWQHEQVVPLRLNLARLTASNPSMMTGPGTNSYIIGTHKDAMGPYLVIDPGPAIPAHIERLANTVGANVQAIICTHSHSDHSPAALPLQALLEQRHGVRVPIVGLPHDGLSNGHVKFTPDRIAVNGEVFQLGSGGNLTSVEIVFTPGHASNHLCLLMLEDKVLLSGDHILSGTTPVIGPPDGDMVLYLNSLDILMTRDIDFIAPAHGYIMRHAPKVMKHLKEHRLKRERKVLSSLTTKPEMVSDMVASVYDDVPEGLHQVAQRSLLAHLLKLEHDGKAKRHKDQQGSDRWELAG